MNTGHAQQTSSFCLHELHSRTVYKELMSIADPFCCIRLARFPLQQPVEGIVKAKSESGQGVANATQKNRVRRGCKSRKPRSITLPHIQPYPA